MDPAQIKTLYTDLGPHAAEDVICRAMEELAQRLCQVQDMALSGPRQDMQKILRSLSAIADQIGMRSLSKVSYDVIDCLELGDFVAEAATLARLARTGERSLTRLWDLNEFSI
ncbi:hypothetical protein J4E08_06240 [Sagittula sp. NFXS13]|uniref:HPt domain-containing protein n=1 Tax=Sagittula marina TaxID=943940 RepID=A0A7W6DIV3_9RHOB|nr:hypothetical protein [Sagittula marina]MBB3984070.1 hypothetical protein [Sagittula marina]